VLRFLNARTALLILPAVHRFYAERAAAGGAQGAKTGAVIRSVFNSISPL